jgi:uncharacterized membrane protein
VAERGSIVESGTADRLIFFSDAVVAIAITLLALDLPVPAGNTVSEFWASARHNDDRYLAFLISFVVIAIAWGNHHRVFRYADRSDARMRTYNMVWLLVIILIPFATNMLTSEGHDSVGANALRFGFYALLQVVLAAAFLAMVHRMTAHGLQSPDTPSAILRDSAWESGSLMLGFGLSIPFFFATPHAWVLWVVIPVAVGQIHRWRDRSRHTSDVSE